MVQFDQNLLWTKLINVFTDASGLRSRNRLSRLPAMLARPPTAMPVNAARRGDG
jgi:hypothetical protein